MPNWVTNRIEFEASSEEEARQIYEAICIDNEFDFKTLDVPTFKDYCVAVGLQDAIFEASGIEKIKLVQEEQQLFDASLAHWYLQRTTCEISTLEWFGWGAFFTFQTAWGIPHPVIVAFGNKFKVPFTHTYIEETSGFWGIEKYELNKDGLIEKTSERFNLMEDLYDLHLEFFGYEPQLDNS
jgi:hypothetical protein